MRIALRSLLASPVNFLALGAGSGLSPVAPGTVGTVAAIPLLLVMPESLPIYLLLLVILFVVGVFLCSVCAKNLGVHDHPAIVWDEWVGFLLTMVAIPHTFKFVLLGFIIFRLFDVLKPWPISWVDKRVHGGFGIMLDDVLAGLAAAIVMQILLRLLA